MNAHRFRISLEFSTPSRTDDFVKRTFKLSDILQLLKQFSRKSIQGAQEPSPAIDWSPRKMPAEKKRHLNCVKFIIYL